MQREPFLESVLALVDERVCRGFDAEVVLDLLASLTTTMAYALVRCQLSGVLAGDVGEALDDLPAMVRGQMPGIVRSFTAAAA